MCKKTNKEFYKENILCANNIRKIYTLQKNIPSNKMLDIPLKYIKYL